MAWNSDCRANVRYGSVGMQLYALDTGCCCLCESFMHLKVLYGTWLHTKETFVSEREGITLHLASAPQ